MNRPLVTIFIAVYNGELYIKECLESILKQSYENIEILIIDDGSTDNTCSIINSYKDKRIRLVKNEVNKGLPYTRNRALELHNGEYFAILDADDIAEIDRIKKQVNLMETNKQIDVVTSDYTIFNDKIRRRIKINKNIEEIKVSLLFGCCLCNSTSMIRSESLSRLRIKYNSSCFVAQDYEMWSQFSKEGSIYNIGESLISYRIGHDNITKRTKNNKKVERKKIISEIQNSLLIHYGFILEDKEKMLFNDFFNDFSESNLLDNYKIIDIFNLIECIKEQNLNNNVFNNRVFINQIDWACKQRIYNHELKLIDKFKLYNLIVENKNIKDLIVDIPKMITKHLLYKVKK